MEHGYVGIDERSKVCHLMESIKTKALVTAKAQIMANADLRTNFNACVTLFKDFIAQERSTQATDWQIAAFKGGGGAVGGSNTNDRYVPDPEWQAMPKDERDKIIAARKAACEAKKKAGCGKGGGGGKGKGPHKKKQAMWMRKEITFQVDKALTARDKDDNNDKEEVSMK